MKIKSDLKNEIYIGVAAILAYLISIANDFHTDDWIALTLLRDGFTLDEVFSLTNARNFRPLTNIFGYLRYLLFGSSPAGYYILNIVLHIIVCVLFYRFLKLIKFHQAAATISAIIFSLYFQHYEAVLLIFGAGRLLAAIFWLLSLISLYNYLSNARRKYLSWFIAFSFMGFLVVEDFWISGIIFLVSAALFAEKQTLSRRLLTILLICASEFLLQYGLRTILIQHTNLFDEFYHPGMHVMRNLADYLGWMILPSPDHAYFSGFALKMGPPIYLAWKIGAVISSLAAIAILLYLLFKAPNNIKFLVVFTVVTLLPALPFLTKVASRYIYIPSMGFTAIAGYYFYILLQKTNDRPTVKKIFLIIASAILALHVIAIQFTSLEYRRTQKMVRSMVTDVKGSGVNLSEYQYVLLDHLPGRAAPGPALWYNFGYNDIIASNDAIGGPYDICKTAMRLRTEGKSFVVFDYEDGHLREKTAVYLSDCAGTR